MIEAVYFLTHTADCGIFSADLFFQFHIIQGDAHAIYGFKIFIKYILRAHI
jgi:hypothetical protein